jgi:hypothetical protein
MLASQKLQVPAAFSGLYAIKAWLLLCALSTLHLLASCGVPVYASEPVITGVSLRNHPGSGMRPSLKTPPRSPQPPTNPTLFLHELITLIYTTTTDRFCRFNHGVFDRSQFWERNNYICWQRSRQGLGYGVRGQLVGV